MFFNEIAAQWLQSKQLELKEASFVKYSNILHNHLLPEWGNASVSQIDGECLRQFAMAKSRILAPKSLYDLLNLSHSIFSYAKERLPEWNVPSIKYPRQNTTEVRCFSMGDQRTLERFLKRTSDPCRLGILLCLYTGMRLGEICALQWKDVSLDDQLIFISKTLQRLQKCDATDKIAGTRILITEPKTSHSKRKIPVPDFLIPLLRKQNIQNQEAYLLTGKKTFMEPRVLQYRFQTYQCQCGLTPLKFHALRHTFATRCIELGFEIKSLSEILGHSNVKITLEKYVHVSWGLKQKNMNLLKPLVA